MRIAVLSTGTELLKGFTVNRDLALIGQALTMAGMPPEREVTASDRPESIREALTWLLPRAEAIIITGGLGPTEDDRTVAVVAEMLGLALSEDTASATAIKEFWTRRSPGLQPPPKVLRQALIPQGATALPNRRGTAPGIRITAVPRLILPGQVLFLLPGPPRELEPMLQEEVIPFLAERNRSARIHTLTSYAAGLPESVAEARITPILERYPEVEMAYCATADALRLHVSGTDAGTVAQVACEIRTALGEHLLIEGTSAPAEELLLRLRRRGWQLAVAESCTGGMVAKSITDVPGASAIFAGGIVAYANAVKSAMLDVNPETLSEHGAVSAECARKMVEGARRRFGAEAAIATTGIAGPDGGSADKPVGLVFIAAAVPGRCEVRRYEFPGDRDQVRHRATVAALCLLRELLPPVAGENLPQWR